MKKEALENGSVKDLINPTPEDEQRTPKLQPSSLALPDAPSHPINDFAVSTSSDQSRGPSLMSLPDSTSSDKPNSSEIATVALASQNISVIIAPEVRDAITKIIANQEEYPLDTLTDLAELLLSTLGDMPLKHRELHTPKSLEEKLDAYKIIRAMWDYAVQRRGVSQNDHAIRYTAACIITCEKDLERWIALANTWFGVFLWPFCGELYPRHCRTTEAATPTYYDYEVQKRDALMRRAVFKRDDYTCIVEGRQTDAAFHRNREKTLIPPKALECAHILERVVSKFSSGRDSDGMSTIDIIRNYCPPPSWSLDLLEDKLDSPSNGITLNITMHLIFDSFVFCFLPVDEKENMYRIKALQEGYLTTEEQNKEITFRDHSHLHGTNEAQMPHAESATRSEVAVPPSVELPDPYLLSIRTAVAHVMHASGAAEFMERCFNRYPSTGSSSAKGILEGPELAFLRINLEETLRQ